MGDDQTKVVSTSKARRGSAIVTQKTAQKKAQVVQVLKHDESMHDDDKKWYQKVSWVCVAFVVILAGLCGYAYVDVNTVKKSNATTVEEETFSEENGVYVNLVVGVVLVFTQYCLVAMCFLSFVGYLFGRKRWWAGPYCTGFIGFGDGSADQVPPERLLTSWGISTVSEDLYFDTKKWNKKEPPVRLARELVLMGYRGRSDDPIVRPGMVVTEVHHTKDRAGEKSSMNLLDDKGGMGNMATQRMSMFSKPSSIELRDKEAAGEKETSQERRKKKQRKLQEKMLLRNLVTGKHSEGGEFEAALLDALSGDAPPDATAIKELHDCFQVHARMQRALLLVQRWWRGHQARNDPNA